MLVANKLDLAGQRQVSRAEGQAVADRFGAVYMECSARSGQSVEEVFMKMGRLMKEKVIDEATKGDGFSLGSPQ